MSHSYTPHCDCQRCTREAGRRAAQAASDPRRVPKLRRTAPASRGASRAEQHGRYVDCGPGAWDDR